MHAPGQVEIVIAKAAALSPDEAAAFFAAFHLHAAVSLLFWMNNAVRRASMRPDQQ